MKLSIITINYNNASGLERTIKSIIPILDSYIEYIVIDGASTDNSADVIKKNSQYIDYWISESDKGVFHAMNKGAAKAQGEYLLYINSGDIINENTDFKRIIKDLNNEDIIYYDIVVTDEEKDISFIKRCDDYIDFKFFIESTLPHQSTFTRREFFIEYGGYNENMKLAGDWAFFMDAVCLKKCSYKHINEYFSTFFADGMSSDMSNFTMLWEEKDTHIRTSYEIYNSFYKDYIAKRQELYKLKTSISVRFLKRIGFLKWLKM